MEVRLFVGLTTRSTRRPRIARTGWGPPSEGIWRPSSRGRLAAGFLVALVGPLAALPVALELTIPSVVFVTVILAATLLGRLAAGLVASAVSIIVMSYDIFPPRGSFTVDVEGLLDVALFLFLAVVLAQLTARQESATASLRDTQARITAILEATRTGAWSWEVGAEIEWSETMGPIFGLPPGSAPPNYEEYVALLHPDERDWVSAVVAKALESGEGYEIEHRVVWPDGTERWVQGQARVEKDAEGKPVRIAGLQRDITPRKRAEIALREADEKLRSLFEEQRDIAQQIQLSLMERRLPIMDGVTAAARYRPSADEMTVGGDWYDMIDLPDGQVAAVVGDVVGHGLAAATTMGKLRSAGNALILTRPFPAEMLIQLDRFAERASGASMCTIACVVVDPVACTIRHASAGHPPMVMISPDGKATMLTQGRSAPLAALAPSERSQGEEPFVPGSTLVLYTDGLVERRSESLDRGLERLLAACEDAGRANVEELADRLLNTLAGDRDLDDDVALLCLRLEPDTDDVLLRRFLASPERLAGVRADLRGWLADAGVGSRDLEDVVLAAGEACANAVEHAYLGDSEDGQVVLEARRSNGGIRLTVSDEGRWRTPEAPGARGRGIAIMRTVMDTVEISRGPIATTVSMSKVLGRAAA